ncbi:MAG TPA: DUF397 domain-containing protein [Trebonia sp.]|nr:DUF397 domain-containing protein [Trebonia sp.]
MEPAAVNPGWRTSSYSGNGGTQCVEAGHIPGAILVRDSAQHGTGPMLRLTPAAWTHLTEAVRVGA